MILLVFIVASYCIKLHSNNAHIVIYQLIYVKTSLHESLFILLPCDVI